MGGKLKHFLVLDFETAYDNEYSLRRMSAPEYILDPRFEVHLLAAYDITWSAPRIVLPEEIPDFLTQYPPEETICCSHNFLFDGAILSYRYNWVPARLVDTLGMCRALRTYPRYSLGAVAKELFGWDSKGDVLPKVKGLSVQGIKNAGLWPQYCSYAMQDASLCMQIYLRLAPEFPEEEAKIMDLVLRATLQPVLRANVSLLETHLEELRRKKARLLNDCGFDRAALMSTAQFQQALESLGVDIKTKTSPAGREVPQFAKSDPFMQELLEYNGSENDDVNYQIQTLAAARLSFKSTIEETRAQKFLAVARLPWGSGALLPMPLRYAGAHTHRLSGEFRMNVQNLPRDVTKSKLRASLIAPPGHKIIAGDLSQIEARITAQLAGQADLIRQFRNNEDVYANFGSLLFKQTITKDETPHHRWIAKTAVLGLGYGCGWERFYKMVIAAARQYSIPINGIFDAAIAQQTVATYRHIFPAIPRLWYTLDSLKPIVVTGGSDMLWRTSEVLRGGNVVARSGVRQSEDMAYQPGDMVRGNDRIWVALANTKNDPGERFGWKSISYQLGPLKVEDGRIALPNGLYLRYAGINPNSVWGATLLENCSQALARIVIMQAAVRLAKLGYRMILQAHDELVFVMPEAEVETAKKTILQEMVRPVSWMPELPLAAEVGVGDNYGETK